MLYERRHWAVKFIWIEYSEKLDVTIYFLVLVTLITLTWIIAYIWFSITYVRLRPKLTWNFYCFVNKYVCDVIHCQNWLLATAFALYLSIFMKFMKPRRTDIKILFASQQNLRTYTGSLIYGVRLQVNVGDRLAKKISQCVAALFWKKNLKKWVSSRMDTVETVAWILIFFIVSVKLNYGYIFFFPNKRKFDDSNFCTKFLIMKEKTINNCPSDTLISLKSNFWMLKWFELLQYGQKLQAF